MSSDSPSERLHTPHLTDYHVHCDYSMDAVGSISDYCEYALRCGLAEICFTTHYDDNPNSEESDCYIRIKGEAHRLTPDLLAPYVEDVRRAHDEFYPRGLAVKLGIEIGWWPGCEESVVAVTNRWPFDYILCGLHDVGDVCICSRNIEGNLGRISPEALVAGYFQRAVLAAKSGLFTSLAHLTYYRRYGEDYYGDIINRLHEPYLAELFAALNQANTGLEINTAAIRHGLGDYYPNIAIVNAARKAGVRVERLGSDSHRPEHLGFDFDGAAPMVAEHSPYYGE